MRPEANIEDFESGLFLFCDEKKINNILFRIFGIEKGITKILINPQTEITNRKPHKLIKNCFEQLEEYFSFGRVVFTVSVIVNGTEFQKKVWEEVSKIPFGKTTTYFKVAKKLGNPHAVRAIGRANGANPLPIIIPCHRVIETNGRLGGYSGGLEIKRLLLNHESAIEPELF